MSPPNPSDTYAWAIRPLWDSVEAPTSPRRLVAALVACGSIYFVSELDGRYRLVVAGRGVVLDVDHEAACALVKARPMRARLLEVCNGTLDPPAPGPELSAEMVEHVRALHEGRLCGHCGRVPT